MCGDVMLWILFFFFKQKTAYEMRISDWSSDVCSSDLLVDEFFSPPLTMLDLAELVDGLVGKNWLAWDSDNLKLHATATGREILARIGGSFRLADFSADWVSMAKRDRKSTRLNSSH